MLCGYFIVHNCTNWGKPSCNAFFVLFSSSAVSFFLRFALIRKRVNDSYIFLLVLVYNWKTPPVSCTPSKQFLVVLSNSCGERSTSTRTESRNSIGLFNRKCLISKVLNGKLIWVSQNSSRGRAGETLYVLGGKKSKTTCLTKEDLFVYGVKIRHWLVDLARESIQWEESLSSIDIIDLLR